jgi:hypothetical protein
MRQQGKGLRGDRTCLPSTPLSAAPQCGFLSGFDSHIYSPAPFF